MSFTLYRPLKDRVVKQLAELLAVMLDKVDDVLYEQGEKAGDDEIQALFFAAMEEVRQKRAEISQKFQNVIARNFDALLNPEGGNSGELSFSMESLSLVEHDEVDERVAVDALVGKARREHVVSLELVTKRLNAILKEKKIKVDENNSPLDPQSIVDAFNDAVKVLSIDSRPRLVFFKQFDLKVVNALNEVYDDASRWLAAQGVLPDLKVERLRKSAAPAGVSAQPAMALADTAPQSSEMVPSGMMSQLMQFMEGMRGMMQASMGGSQLPVVHNGVAYVGGVPMPSDTPVTVLKTDDLMMLLDKLQHRQQAEDRAFGDEEGEIIEAEVIREDVKSDLGALLNEQAEDAGTQAIEQADDDVISLLSMIFDFILDDDTLRPEIKALIGRLQIPMMKVAISDAQFFESDQHPARRLINALATAGLGWNPSEDELDKQLYEKIQDIVFEVLNNFENDQTLFEDLLEELEQFMVGHKRRQEAAARRLREIEEGQARKAIAEKTIRQLLSSRLGNRKLPSVAGKILMEYWQQLLLIVHMRDGQDSEAWQKHAKVVDVLIWVLLKPKDSGHRQKQQQLFPRLLNSLKKGLAEIHADPLEVNDLLEELKQVFATLQEAGQEASVETEEIAIQAEEESEASIEVDPAMLRAVEALPVGSWLEFVEGDNARRLKLAAKILAVDKFVFINKRGIKEKDLKAAELARQIQENTARIIEEGALVDRALERVIGNMRKLQANASS